MRAARPAARRNGGKTGDAGGTPGSEAQGSPGRWQGFRPGVRTILVDPAAMAVYGGKVNGEAHVAHAVAGGGPKVHRSTAPEMLREFQPCSLFYAHVDPVEVVDGIVAIADQIPYDACVRNRARAHTRRIQTRYEALPGFVEVWAEPGTANHVCDRVSEVLGDPFFGNQGPQRRVYDVMSFCHEVIRYHVPLHPFHRLVLTNALLFPVRRNETFEAAANSFCRLLRNWPTAIFLGRSLTKGLSVPFGW